MRAIIDEVRYAVYFEVDSTNVKADNKICQGERKMRAVKLIKEMSLAFDMVCKGITRKPINYGTK